MPAPMPPQGAPQSSPQGQPDDSQGGSGGAIQELMQNVQGALAHLADFINQAPEADDQEKQLIGQIVQMFDALVQGAGGGEEQAQPSASPMEAGGNKNAAPSPV